MELKALPVTLLPARKTLWKHLIVMSLVAGMGAFSVYGGVASVAGWGLLAIGGILMLIAIVQLLPGAASLTLDEDGFHVTGLYRRTSYRWDEIEGFGVYQANGKKKMCGFNFLEGSRPKSFLMNMSRSKIGYEAALGDLYGPDPDALAEMMNAYLDRQTEDAVS
jgi:hypothetical protein